LLATGVVFPSLSFGFYAQRHHRRDFGDWCGRIYPKISAMALLLHALDTAAGRRTIIVRYYPPVEAAK
jgi:hypothetical protein